MEFKEIIEKRASVRVFTEEPVPVEDLKELARLGSLAPSVNNYQPWEFTAVTNKDLLEKMAFMVAKKLKSVPENSSQAAKNVLSQVEWYSTFFEDAPSVLAISMKDYETVLEFGSELSHEDINKLRNYPDMQSAGACIENILLGAVSMGYGACWLSAPMIAKKDLEEILKLDEENHLIAFVAIGKSKTEVKPKPKKSIDDLFRIIE